MSAKLESKNGTSVFFARGMIGAFYAILLILMIFTYTGVGDVFDAWYKMVDAVELGLPTIKHLTLNVVLSALGWVYLFVPLINVAVGGRFHKPVRATVLHTLHPTVYLVGLPALGVLFAHFMPLGFAMLPIIISCMLTAVITSYVMTGFQNTAFAMSVRLVTTYILATVLSTFFMAHVVVVGTAAVWMFVFLKLIKMSKLTD